MEGQAKLEGQAVISGAFPFYSSGALQQARQEEIVEFDGVRLFLSTNVYPPHEDSLLLARAVKKFAFGQFLDLGCGSGLQAIFAARKNSVEKVVGVDASTEALEISEKNALLNGVERKCVFLKSNLFSALAGEKFDCIAFNPPYLPTSREEKLEGELNSAFDGGSTGRETMDEFISQAKNFLAPQAIVLLVSSSLSSSNPFEDGNKETLRKLEQKGFSAEIVERQKFFFEEIVVFKAQLK